MVLSAGDKLGPYEITALLGKGGMGEVYRATDSRLHRDVAIKVSTEQFSDRFEREARAVAALNHPNVSQLYDVGSNYLVMELVDGETLADRIKRGPIPLEEALTLARQITDALEAAHEKGITHRDLKPANIKITPEGTLKVLDFGLAKIAEPVSQAGSDPEHSPTMTLEAATRVGAVMGTAGYMAPEQAKGKKVDKRADIWAFGVVLYEMLAGKRLFAGEDLTDTLAMVVRDTPDLTAAPDRVRRLLSRCLEKDPKRRLRDISVAWELLEEESAPSGRGLVTSWLWPAAVLSTAVTVGLAFVHFREAAPELLSYAYTIPPPPNTAIHSFAISADGRQVAIAAGAGGQTSLWVRDLDSFEPRELSGTAGAIYPFWSPDRRFIGFAVGSERKKIPADGGPVTNIAAGGGIPVATWNQDGVILSQGPGGGIYRANASGGAYTALLESPLVLGHPFFLPDGGRFLYTVTQGPEDKRGIYAASLDSSTENRRLLPENGPSVYAPPRPGSSTGHIIFGRDGFLVAQPVDGKLRPAGELIQIAERADTRPGTFSVSNTGVLLYQSEQSITARLTFTDRTGKKLMGVGEPADIIDFALSPDEKRIVFAQANSITNSSTDLWMYDSERKMATRFTAPAGTRNVNPIWSPDGTTVVFSSNRSGRTDLYQKAVAGVVAGQAIYVTTDSFKFASDWSRDGKFLLFTESIGGEGAIDIYALPSGGGKPLPVVQAKFDQTKPQLSPDNRWLAYVSDESGRNEVYIQPFSLEAKPAEQRWQISAGGGTDPRWRRDGRELFFLAADQKLMSVAIGSATERAGSTEFAFDSPQPLFALTPTNSMERRWSFRYAVTADGKRFLVLENSGDSTPTPITVLANWQAGLQK